MYTKLQDLWHPPLAYYYSVPPQPPRNRCSTHERGETTPPGWIRDLVMPFLANTNRLHPETQSGRGTRTKQTDDSRSVLKNNRVLFVDCVRLNHLTGSWMAILLPHSKPQLFTPLRMQVTETYNNFPSLPSFLTFCFHSWVPILSHSIAWSSHPNVVPQQCIYNRFALQSSFHWITFIINI